MSVPQLSVEILDHIFSFLASDRDTLAFCSKDPLLGPIVERHFYSHLTVHMGLVNLESNHAFRPIRLLKFLIENPHIPHYVKTLEILDGLDYQQKIPSKHLKVLHEFQKTLLMYPVLECVMLKATPNGRLWHLSDSFRVALERLVNLPTVKEVHFVDFPLSLLDNCKGIKKLLISGLQGCIYAQICHPTLPQLTSLTLPDRNCSSSTFAWLNDHINELRFLKCGSLWVLEELVEACAGTLTKLDVEILDSCQFVYLEGKATSCNIQQLTIRTIVDQSRGLKDRMLSVSRTINTFASSLRNLVLDINVVVPTCSDLLQLDFSSLLAVLENIAPSVSLIDLYVHSGVMPSGEPPAPFFPSLVNREDTMRLVKEGTVVIHWQMTAPSCV